MHEGREAETYFTNEARRSCGCWLKKNKSLLLLTITRQTLDFSEERRNESPKILRAEQCRVSVGKATLRQQLIKLQLTHDLQ